MENKISENSLTESTAVPTEYLFANAARHMAIERADGRKGEMVGIHISLKALQVRGVNNVFLPLAEAVKLFDALSRSIAIASNDERVVEFKVFGVSKNTNSFGLTGMYIVSREGMTFELCVSALHVKKVGDVVRVPVINGMIQASPGFFFEIPEKKPDCPAEILEKIWK